MKVLKDNKKPTIGVIGLGYVGLPLAIEFSKKYNTIGFDKSKERIEQLKASIDKTLEVSKGELQSSQLLYTIDPGDIDDCNVYIVTVPTPIDQYNNPEMEPLRLASSIIGKRLRKGNIVIYESTVYPGATEEYCVPILEKESGLLYNKDFLCGYSPERINPGDKEHSLTRIMKVTSGSNNEAAKFVDDLYSSIISAGTYKVSSIAVAESAKVIENIQRDVNIALINELAIIFNKLNIDSVEVLEAAGTKWNFLPFRPGLVGGHCIGVDPYYMTYKAIELGCHPEMILAGRRINDNMGKSIADTTIREMAKSGINPIGSNITLLGLTFKENCPDLRNTKIPDIIKHLTAYNCEITVADPFADTLEAKKLYDIDLEQQRNINNSDAVILAVCHDIYKTISIEKWQKIFNDKGVLIDIKSIYPNNYFSGTNILHWRL